MQADKSHAEIRAPPSMRLKSRALDVVLDHVRARDERWQVEGPTASDTVLRPKLNGVWREKPPRTDQTTRTKLDFFFRSSNATLPSSTTVVLSVNRVADAPSNYDVGQE